MTLALTRPSRPGRITARGVGPSRLLAPVTAGLAAVAGLSGAFTDPAVAGWVFVAAALVGLPHGAADHVALAWASGRRVSAGATLRTAGFYAGGVVVALVALLASPAAAVCAALAVSAWHFGTTDCAARERGGWAVAAAFGLVPVAGPLALWPGRSAAFLDHLAPSVARGVEGGGHAVLLAALAVSVVAAGVALARRHMTVELVELALLVALVWAAPPAVAVGVYFGLWHSPRQAAVILAAGRRGSGGGGDALRRLIGWSAPTTAVSVAAIGAVWALAPMRLWPQIALIALLAVSLPHSVVVARLDGRPVATRSRR